MNVLTIIHKTEGYYSDLRKAGAENLPKTVVVFQIKSICNYLLYGTSFSEFAAYGFYRKSRKEKLSYMTRR